MTAPTLTASYVLGRKLDSIPFSAYHVLVIVVLALVARQLGFGTVAGVALFYLVFLANLIVPIVRKGFVA